MTFDDISDFNDHFNFINNMHYSKLYTTKPRENINLPEWYYYERNNNIVKPFIYDNIFFDETKSIEDEYLELIAYENNIINNTFNNDSESEDEINDDVTLINRKTKWFAI